MPSTRPLPIPRDRAGRFVNWAATERSRPAVWHLPASEDAVVRMVRSARDSGRRLRVVGAGHSFSPIAVPDQDAVSLDGLGGQVQVDSDRTHVTVPAGMRLRDLSAALQRDGLSLPVVGSIQAQSAAGAIATGTHGSSLTHGNLATLVTGLRLVSGTGEVVDLTADDPRLDAARVHLGALGIVTRVTLTVREAVRLHQTIEHLPIGEVAAALPDIARSAEYVKVWWLAHTPYAQVIRYSTTDEPVTRRPSPATMRWIDERVMHRSVFPALVRFQHRRPAATAAINRRLAQVYLGAASQVGPDALMLNTPMPMRHRETEAAVPMERAGAAITEILGLFVGGRPAINFPLEIRFVRGDASWMSPAYGGDTCQIGAYTTNGPDCASYFDAFWRAMRPLDARPHWGKEMSHEAAELRGLYPRFDEFAGLRDTLDPDRVFGGAFHTRLLGS